MNDAAIKRGQNIKYLPRVFTEQGVAMLATILKSKVATQTSIAIMDAFVTMHKYISSNLIEQRYINGLVYRHDEEILKLKETLDQMQEKTEIHAIFFEGQIYDAYSILVDILNEAKNEIIIIDNYAGKELLDLLKSIDTKIVIISKNLDEVLIKKYQNQYDNIVFYQLDIFHDRFVILDREKLYHCGSSFKDLGKKCFAINEMISEEILNILLDKIFLENKKG